MINVPDNYEEIRADRHTVQYRLDIDGTSYYQDKIEDESGTLELALFDTLTIGNAVSRIFTVNVDLQGDFSQVDLYFRLYKDAQNYTEWLPKGKYFVSTQEDVTNGITKLVCYDAMQKANAIYMKTGEWDSPYSDTLVERIAEKMGIEVNEDTADFLTENRFQITSGFVIGDEGTTMRDFLCYISAVYAGSFIIDDYGNLKLWKYGDNWSEPIPVLSTEKIEILSYGDIAIRV